MEGKKKVEQLEEERGRCVNVLSSGFLLYKELHDKLYEHQKEGLVFLYKVHQENKKGAIIADDMGLGKTIQTITFLSGMIVMERMRSVLLVMPNSLLENWGAELRKWTPWIKFHIFHSRYKDREGRVLEVQRKGHVLLTSFRMLINSERTLSTYRDSQFIWDCIIFDEAHMIRNSTTKTFKAAFSIPAKTRILLTGTPVQNNLQELWSLFHLACQGSLLGTYRSFRKLYENPIMRGREKDASPSEKALGLKTSESLTEMIKPYYLRRTKEDIQRESKEPNKDTVKIAQFTKKNDLVMWVHLSPLQERLYRKLINQIILRGYNDSALTDLATMKKICDHPRLFTAKEYTELQCDDEGKPDLSNGHVMKDFCENKTCHLLSKELIEESGKMTFLVALLERLRKEGNRTLVFSESRKMLDIIEQVLNERGFKMLRVDETLTAADQRHCLITAFQNRSEYSIFLLTSQVGGLGFNLTAANRVVIVDPSWNPATDSQAVDRAYRIGQEKDVVVYRLITCGTIEEKIYRRQIFKNSLVRQTIGEDRNPIRYFSKQELEQLFTVEDTRFSSTQYHLQTIHWNQPKRNKTLDDHIAYLSTLNISGISDHGLLFSASLMENFEQESAQNQIRLQVQKAQQKIEDESLFFHHTMDSSGYFGHGSSKNRSNEHSRVHSSTPDVTQKYKLFLSPKLLKKRKTNQNTKHNTHTYSDKTSVFLKNDVSWHAEESEVSAPVKCVNESKEEHYVDETKFGPGYDVNSRFVEQTGNRLFTAEGGSVCEGRFKDFTANLKSPADLMQPVTVCFSSTDTELIPTPGPETKWDGTEATKKGSLRDKEYILETNSIELAVHSRNTAGTNDMSMVPSGSKLQTPMQLPVLCDYSLTPTCMSYLTDNDNKSPPVSATLVSSKKASHRRAGVTPTSPPCAENLVFRENNSEKNDISPQCSRKLNFYEEGVLEICPREENKSHVSGKIHLMENDVHSNCEEAENPGHSKFSCSLESEQEDKLDKFMTTEPGFLLQDSYLKKSVTCTVSDKNQHKKTLEGVNHNDTIMYSTTKSTREHNGEKVNGIEESYFCHLPKIQNLEETCVPQPLPGCMGRRSVTFESSKMNKNLKESYFPDKDVDWDLKTSTMRMSLNDDESYLQNNVDCNLTTSTVRMSLEDNESYPEKNVDWNLVTLSVLKESQHKKHTGNLSYINLNASLLVHSTSNVIQEEKDEEKDSEEDSLSHVPKFSSHGKTDVPQFFPESEDQKTVASETARVNTILEENCSQPEKDVEKYLTTTSKNTSINVTASLSGNNVDSNLKSLIMSMRLEDNDFNPEKHVHCNLTSSAMNTSLKEKDRYQDEDEDWNLTTSVMSLRSEDNDSDLEKDLEFSLTNESGMEESQNMKTTGNLSFIHLNTSLPVHCTSNVIQDEGDEEKDGEEDSLSHFPKFSSPEKTDVPQFFPESEDQKTVASETAKVNTILEENHSQPEKDVESNLRTSTMNASVKDIEFHTERDMDNNLTPSTMNTSIHEIAYYFENNVDNKFTISKMKTSLQDNDFYSEKDVETNFATSPMNPRLNEVASYSKNNVDSNFKTSTMTSGLDDKDICIEKDVDFISTTLSGLAESQHMKTTGNLSFINLNASLPVHSISNVIKDEEDEEKDSEEEGLSHFLKFSNPGKTDVPQFYPESEDQRTVTSDTARVITILEENCSQPEKDVENNLTTTTKNTSINVTASLSGNNVDSNLKSLIMSMRLEDKDFYPEKHVHCNLTSSPMNTSLKEKHHYQDEDEDWNLTPSVMCLRSEDNDSDLEKDVDCILTNVSGLEESQNMKTTGNLSFIHLNASLPVHCTSNVKQDEGDEEKDGEEDSLSHFPKFSSPAKTNVPQFFPESEDQRTVTSKTARVNTILEENRSQPEKDAESNLRTSTKNMSVKDNDFHPEKDVHCILTSSAINPSLKEKHHYQDEDVDWNLTPSVISLRSEDNDSDLEKDVDFILTNKSGLEESQNMKTTGNLSFNHLSTSLPVHCTSNVIQDEGDEEKDSEEDSLSHFPKFSSPGKTDVPQFFPESEDQKTVASETAKVNTILEENHSQPEKDVESNLRTSTMNTSVKDIEFHTERDKDNNLTPSTMNTSIHEIAYYSENNVDSKFTISKMKTSLQDNDFYSEKDVETNFATSPMNPRLNEVASYSKNNVDSNFKTSTMTSGLDDKDICIEKDVDFISTTLSGLAESQHMKTTGNLSFINLNASLPVHSISNVIQDEGDEEKDSEEEGLSHFLKFSNPGKTDMPLFYPESEDQRTVTSDTARVITILEENCSQPEKDVENNLTTTTTKNTSINVTASLSGNNVDSNLKSLIMSMRLEDKDFYPEKHMHCNFTSSPMNTSLKEKHRYQDEDENWNLTPSVMCLRSEDNDSDLEKDVDCILTNVSGLEESQNMKTTGNLSFIHLNASLPVHCTSNVKQDEGDEEKDGEEDSLSHFPKFSSPAKTNVPQFFPESEDQRTVTSKTARVNTILEENRSQPEKDAESNLTTSTKNMSVKDNDFHPEKDVHCILTSSAINPSLKEKHHYQDEDVDWNLTPSVISLRSEDNDSDLEKDMDFILTNESGLEESQNMKTTGNLSFNHLSTSLPVHCTSNVIQDEGDEEKDSEEDSLSHFPKFSSPGKTDVPQFFPESEDQRTVTSKTARVNTILEENHSQPEKDVESNLRTSTMNTSVKDIEFHTERDKDNNLTPSTMNTSIHEIAYYSENNVDSKFTISKMKTSLQDNDFYSEKDVETNFATSPMNPRLNEVASYSKNNVDSNFKTSTMTSGLDDKDICIEKDVDFISTTLSGLAESQHMKTTGNLSFINLNASLPVHSISNVIQDEGDEEKDSEEEGLSHFLKFSNPGKTDMPLFYPESEDQRTVTSDTARVITILEENCSQPEKDVENNLTTTTTKNTSINVTASLSGNNVDSNLKSLIMSMRLEDKDCYPEKHVHCNLTSSPMNTSLKEKHRYQDEDENWNLTPSVMCLRSEDNDSDLEKDVDCILTNVSGLEESQNMKTTGNLSFIHLNASLPVHCTSNVKQDEGDEEKDGEEDSLSHFPKFSSPAKTNVPQFFPESEDQRTVTSKTARVNTILEENRSQPKKDPESYLRTSTMNTSVEDNHFYTENDVNCNLTSPTMVASLKVKYSYPRQVVSLKIPTPSSMKDSQCQLSVEHLFNIDETEDESVALRRDYQENKKIPTEGGLTGYDVPSEGACVKDRKINRKLDSSEKSNRLKVRTLAPTFLNTCLSKLRSWTKM